MEGAYDKAKIYYTKALQLGEDADSEANLAKILFLQSRQKGRGLPRPDGGQPAKASKAQAPTASKGAKETSHSQSGGGGGGAQSDRKKQTKPSPHPQKRLPSKPEHTPHPLSSKVYELINKGYVYETKPW